MRLYLNLSLHLAKAYMIYFELNKKSRSMLIQTSLNLLEKLEYI